MKHRLRPKVVACAKSSRRNVSDFRPLALKSAREMAGVGKRQRGTSCSSNAPWMGVSEGQIVPRRALPPQGQHMAGCHLRATKMQLGIMRIMIIMINMTI